MSASAALLRPLQRASSPAGGISDGYVKLMIPGRGGVVSGGGTRAAGSGASALAGRPGGATSTLYSDAKNVAAKTKGNRRAAAAAAAADGSGEVDIAAGGRIELIFGPMFAGKTTELLRRCQVAESAGRNVVLIKSSSDTRYSAGEAVTHDGAKRSCFAMQSLTTILDNKENASEQMQEGAANDVYNVYARYAEAHVIAIDEAQFFDDLEDFCTRAADVDGKEIIVAGLDGDFKRRKFGQVLDLVPHADDVTKLTARCAKCSAPGLFSLRISAEKDTTLIGGKDKYLPVCRRHYFELSA